MPDNDQPTETEIKLRLPAAAFDTLARHAVMANATPDQRHQITTYFDTPDLDLARHGFHLRIRRSGTHRLQTLKTAAGHAVASQRGEWEQPVETDTPDLAALADTPAASALRDIGADRLRPAFTTDIHRTTRLIHVDRDATIEAAFDHGVIIACNRSEPVSELELELKQGDVAALYRLAAALVAAVPMALEPASKAERGLHLRSGTSPSAVKAADVAFAPGLPASAAFAAIIRAILHHIITNLAPARGGDVEGVHQLRVAIRRMRAALRLFRPLLQEQVATQFDTELWRVGQVFGVVRDWDVFLHETLPAAETNAAERPWFELLRTQSEIRRTTAQQDMRSELDGPAFTGLLLGLAGWIEDGAQDPMMLGNERLRHPLSDLAPELIKPLSRTVAKRGRRLDEASHEALHALRKSIKRLRYALEFLAPLYPHRQVKAAVDACKNLQEILGQVNDAAVTPDLAERLVGGRPELLPGLAALASWAEQRSRKAHRRVPKAWRRLQDADGFWN